MKAEGALLEAYTYMMDKNWPAAVNALKPAATMLATMAPPSESEKNSASLNYDNDRGGYYDIAQKANDLALSSQSSFVVSQIDSLHTHQIENANKLADYYRFNDEFARRSFFARGIDKVKEDVEYALAKAEKTLGIKGAAKDLQKASEAAEEVDDELKKLQEELKALEQGGQ